MVAIALNLQPDTSCNAQVELKGCGRVMNTRVLGYSGELSGFFERKSSLTQAGSNTQVTLAPWSIPVVDLTLARE